MGNNPDPVVYVFLNGGLEMSVGAVAAQAAHAAAQIFSNLPEEDLATFWRDQPHKTVIVLKARDEMHLRNIQDYMSNRGVGGELLVDEGGVEYPPHTITAYVTTILDRNKTGKLMSTFEKYYEDDAMRGFLRALGA